MNVLQLTVVDKILVLDKVNDAMISIESHSIASKIQKTSLHKLRISLIGCEIAAVF